MSILIKGMEMPKNCIRKMPIKFSELDLRDGLCPLIELPPHGRLIDADALIKQMTEEGWADGCGWADALDLALAPTIIESDGEE